MGVFILSLLRERVMIYMREINKFKFDKPTYSWAVASATRAGTRPLATKVI